MTREEALTYTARLCNKAEYCRAEIATKLRTKGLSAGDIDAVVDELERQRLVDDRRFALAFVRTKFRNQLWGRRKIAIELQRRRIARTAIDEALAQITDHEYTAALRALIDRKTRTIATPVDAPARASLARTLIGRGFEPSIVFSLLPR